MTQDPLFIIVLLSVLAVVVILAIGLGGFAGGGEFNKRNANKIMRLRLMAQFVAVLLIVGFVWLRGGLG